MGLKLQWSEDDEANWSTMAEALAKALGRTVHETERLGERYGWSPVPNSQAMQDRADRGWQTSGGHENPFIGLHTILTTRLLAFNDHLATAMRLQEQDPTVFGPYIVARPALEVASMIAWTADPDVAPKVRVGRFLQDRAVSMRDQKTTAALMKYESEAKRKHARFAARVRHWGFEPVFDGTGEFITNVKGVPTKKHHERMAWLLQDGNEPVGAMSYRWLSGYMHGDPLRLQDRLEIQKAEPGESIGGYVTLTMKPGLVALVVSLMLSASLAAMRRLARYYMWDDRRWRQALLVSRQQIHPHLPAVVPNTPR